MSVQSMKMISIIGEYSRLDDTIQACIRTGCYQPEQTSDLMENIKDFFHINDENPYAGLLHRISEIFEIGKIKPEIVSIAGEQLSKEEVDQFIDTLGPRLKGIQQNRQELTKKLDGIETDLANLQHFDTIEVNLQEAFSAEFVKVRFGKIPIEGYNKLPSYQSNPYVLFFPCYNDENYYWGVYLAPREQAREIDRIFASLFFERLRLPGSTSTPHEAIECLQQDKAECERLIKVQDDLIAGYFTNQRDECMKLFTYVKAEYDAYEIRRYATKYHNSFLLVGWVPEQNAQSFMDSLSRVDGIEVAAGKPNPDSERFSPPTKMKNFRLFRPFEFYIKMYGVPNYAEMDPTAFVAITYCLLFGVMFADVGQGIVLAIIGYLMYKYKKMDIGRILVPCGIFSVMGGLLFGSVFGFEEALDPLYHAVGLSEKPFDVMSSPTELLGYSVAVGIVLIILTMILNVYSSLKQHKPVNAIFSQSGLMGIVLFVSLLVIICNASFGWGLSNLPFVIFGCILPVILIFLKEIFARIAQGKHAKPDSVSDYIIENSFELMEVLLSFLSNTLSFLRVGAFVLVHAVMMMVFFTIADMAGPGVVYALIVILGNAFVIVLEGLLVSIQVLRLEFYEMFSRFYIGDGLPFEPIRVKAD